MSNSLKIIYTSITWCASHFLTKIGDIDLKLSLEKRQRLKWRQNIPRQHLFQKPKLTAYNPVPTTIWSDIKQL